MAAVLPRSKKCSLFAENNMLSRCGACNTNQGLDGAMNLVGASMHVACSARALWQLEACLQHIWDVPLQFCRSMPPNGHQQALPHVLQRPHLDLQMQVP